MSARGEWYFFLFFYVSFFLDGGADTDKLMGFLRVNVATAERPLSFSRASLVTWQLHSITGAASLVYAILALKMQMR